MSSIFLNFKYNFLFKYETIRKLEIMYRKFFEKIQNHNFIMVLEGIENLIVLFEETKDQVEYFFYIPIEFTFEQGDPDRLSYDLQVKIDEIIQKFIKKHIPEEKVVTLTGTVEERLEQISKYL